MNSQLPKNEDTHDLTIGVSTLDRTSSVVVKPTTSQSLFYRDKQTGFIFEAESSEQVLKAVWQTIRNRGFEYQSQRGPIRSIRGATMIITNPLNESANYPYWSKDEDDWYQTNFVQKETNSPPEILTPGSDIYTYKYVWRSRYYDSGYGYIKAVLQALKKQKQTIGKLNRPGLIEILKKTYNLVHPETTLAVLAWKGTALIQFYQENPQLLDQELQNNRRDTLESIIDEIKTSPNSRRAITPSLTYEQIDHSGTAGGVPVYQNYQLYTEVDLKGNPTGLISFHLHRAMDAMGGTQLDISHDRNWGQIASQAIGLPLKKIVIYCNDIYFNVPTKNAHQDLAQKTNIRSWLFAVTDSFNPKTEDIEKRLNSPSYQKKLDFTLSRIKNGK